MAKKRTHRNHGSRISSKTKAALKKAGRSVVTVTTHNLPEDMFEMELGIGVEYVLSGCGLIIECEPTGDADASYLSTVVAPAVLFERTNGLQPTLIKVDVILSPNKVFDGKLLGCDFHNNLAAITIRSDSPLQAAPLQGIDDVSSIDINDHNHSSQLFQLRPHSSLFKVRPMMKIMTLIRNVVPPYKLCVDHGLFGETPSSPYLCKELYGVIGACYQADFGGAVVNHNAKIIGLMFYHSPFLPSNLISRWWNHYKSQRKFCRPYVGVEIVNIATAPLYFLEQLTNKFSDISSGVVVTKVEDDTPAYCSGIRRNDVIVKCDGVSLRSKMEFLEKMWDNAGKSVELNVVRLGDDQPLTFSMTIGDTTPDKFYRWQVPSINIIKAEPMPPEQDSSEDSMAQ